MLFGYARISTKNQTNDRQQLQLSNYGCEKIFHDVISGAKFDRTGLNDLINSITVNDTLVVTHIDRLGRSLKQLLQVIEQVEAKGADFISLSQGFDTRTASGKLIFSVFGAVAEFERSLIVDRTKQGLEAVKVKGIKLGRKRKVNHEMVNALQDLKKTGRSVAEICNILKISKATYYRYK